jgi:hypothetical protein
MWAPVPLGLSGKTLKHKVKINYNLPTSENGHNLSTASATESPSPLQ